MQSQLDMHMFPFNSAVHGLLVCRHTILLAQHRASWIIYMFRLVECTVQWIVDVLFY